nr:PEPxxWA-CTERM sorting domain-containing protein [Polymorphobacter sp.]
MVARTALAAALVAPAAGSAIPTQSWNGYRWGRTGAIVINVGDNYGAVWKPFTTKAMAQWSVAPAISMASTAGSTTSACNMVYGTIQMCSGNYGATGWLGYTNVQTSSGYIVMATIRLNDYYFSQPKYDTAAWRAETACQELGNALGLQDSDHVTTNANTGSCMDYTNSPTGGGNYGTLENLQPSSSDMKNLNAIYAQPGGRQVVGTGKYGSANAAVPEPAAWTLMIVGFGLAGGIARRQRGRTDRSLLVTADGHPASSPVQR